MQFAYRTGVVLSSRWRLVVNPRHKVLLFPTEPKFEILA